MAEAGKASNLCPVWHLCSWGVGLCAAGLYWGWQEAAQCSTLTQGEHTLVQTHPRLHALLVEGNTALLCSAQVKNGFTEVVN